MTVVDLRAIPVQVLVNNGFDDLDVSIAFQQLSCNSHTWDDRGWFQPEGSLTLAAYVDGFNESFDCRVNPSRWAPGNTVKILLWFGYWIPLPWVFKILKHPNRPYPGNPDITINLGTDATLLSYREPEGDPTGVEYGTSTSATFLVNAALAKAGAPQLTDTIENLFLPFSPGKNQGGSWINYAGQVAYSGGYILWQQGNGLIRSTPLTTSGLVPFAHYVVGRDEADYIPEMAQESPPEDVRFTGTTYKIDDVGDTTNVSIDTVDGVTVRTTVTYRDRDTNSPTYIEKVEQPANVVLPILFPSNGSLITDSELTRDWFYANNTARLNREIETIRVPVSRIFPNDTFGNPTDLTIETRQTIDYTYDSENTVLSKRTTLEKAVISGITVTVAVSQIIIEKWEKVGPEEYTYNRVLVNRDGSVNPLPQRRGGSTNNKPPSTQYRPAEKQRTEKKFLGEAKFTSPAGNGFAEKLWAVTLPSGMCVSNQQCRDRAQTWGSIRQGRQFAIQWAADITQGWLENFNPVRRIDFTVDGRRTAYLVEALNIQVDKKSAAIGGRGIELGLVSVDAPLPLPSVPGDPPTPDLPIPETPFVVSQNIDVEIIATARRCAGFVLGTLVDVAVIAATARRGNMAVDVELPIVIEVAATSRRGSMVVGVEQPLAIEITATARRGSMAVGVELPALINVEGTARRGSMAVSVAGFEPETLTLLAALTGTYGSARRVEMNALIKSLKDAGVWATLNQLCVAGLNSGDSLINWRSPGTLNATLVNAPAFTADRGFTGNGTNSYINSNLTPSTIGSNFTQNSNSISVYSRTDSSGDFAEVGLFAGSNQFAITARRTVSGTPNRFTGRANEFASDADNGTNSDSRGLFSTNRVSSTSVVSYRNGTQIQSKSTTSVALSGFNAPLAIGALPVVGSSSVFFYSTRQYAAWALGAGRSADQEAAFNSALTTYLTHIGAAV